MNGDTEVDAPRPVGEARKKTAKKPEGLLPKVLRLAALMLVVAAVLGTLGYRRVQGQISETLLGAGAQMMMLDEADHQDRPRELVVNGQRIHFSSGVAPMAPRELLDAFQARCEEVDADLMARFSEVVAEHPDEPRARRLESLGPVLREEREGVGYVACFDLGRERAELDVIVRRFRAFRESRDLHDFGDLRYVYAQPASREGHTHFVAIWSEGSLHMDQLLVESGDARGEDPDSIPRPPGSRRILTAYESGVPDVATIYRGSELEEGGLDSFYRRELPARGWTILDTTDGSRAHRSLDVRPALVAQRGDRIVFFALGTDADGSGTAAIVTTGPDDESGDT